MVGSLLNSAQKWAEKWGNWQEGEVVFEEKISTFAMGREEKEEGSSTLKW